MSDGQETDINIGFRGGFWPSTADLGPEERKGAVRDGLNVIWTGEGYMLGSAGLGVGPNGIGAPRLFSVAGQGGVSQIASVNGTGSIVPYLDKLFYYISKESGAGVINLGGVNYNGTGGRLKYSNGTLELNAGLAAPATAPSLIAGNAGQIVSGATNLCITRIRTGNFVIGNGISSPYEESLASVPSNIVAVQNKKILAYNWPAVGTGADAHDAWGVYITPSNEASLPGNPFLYLGAIMETSIQASLMVGMISYPRAIELDFTDGNLLPQQIPTDNFPPPTGELVINLNDCLAVLNTGTNRSGFASSLSGRPGAFPLLGARQNMSPPEPIICTSGRGMQSEIFAGAANSVQRFVLSGNPDAPIYNSPFWESDGIASPQAICFAQTEMFAFLAECSPARSDGSAKPDTSFAIPVREYIRLLQWDVSQVSVGYDPVYDFVVFAHIDTAMVWCRSLGIWGVPIFLNANQGSRVALLSFNNKLIVAKGSGLFTWETGSGNTTGFLETHKYDDPVPSEMKIIIGYRAYLEQNNPSIELWLDDASSAEYTLNDTGTGKHYTKWDDTLLASWCTFFRLKFQGISKGNKIFQAQVKLITVPDVRAVG